MVPTGVHDEWRARAFERLADRSSQPDAGTNPIAFRAALPKNRSGPRPSIPRAVHPLCQAIIFKPWTCMEHNERPGSALEANSKHNQLNFESHSVRGRKKTLSNRRASLRSLENQLPALALARLNLNARRPDQALQLLANVNTLPGNRSASRRCMRRGGMPKR